jgi:hypothetical protein
MVATAIEQYYGQKMAMRATLGRYLGILPPKRWRLTMPATWSVIPEVQLECEPFFGPRAVEWKN